jgi:hypothetical protein
MSAGFPGPSAGPCTKFFGAVFGSLFLISILSVPVTTRTSELRQDPGSNIVFKMTYPRDSTMFLPRYLSFRARSAGSREVHVRSAQWIGTMVIIAVLGVFDYFVFCRLLRRKRRASSDP